MRRHREGCQYGCDVRRLSIPIHDWTQLEPGDFHHFHQAWICEVADALNGGLLRAEYVAMIEQGLGESIVSEDEVGLESDTILNAQRADRISIRRGRGKVVAIIEMMSSGNKGSRNAIRTFVEKAADILNQGVHLLVVDLYPPTPRDPQGIHKAIWDEFGDAPFELPPDKPLTVASYFGGDSPEAYVEPVGVGDVLPSLPIFLSDSYYIPAPLEETYQEAWAVFPATLKGLIEPKAE